MSPETKVLCDKTDCAFFTKKPGSTSIFCTQGDKPHHMHEDVCPLYRPDWSKANDKMAELKKRFGIGKK